MNRPRGELRLRILSALVLGPLTLSAVYAGSTVFAVLIMIVGMLAAVEWGRLVAPELGLIGDLAGCLAPILAGITTLTMGPWAGLVGLCAAGLILAGVYVRLRGWRVGMAAVAYPYVGGTIVALIWLRDLPDAGLGLVYWLFFAVWASDVGGYVTGRIIGGPKLAPAISPNKTWAGVAGGVVWAVCFAAAVSILFAASEPFYGLVMAVVVSFVAQLGDLFESGMKRHYGVKNSGELIPGHGGVLDRIDGLLAAAPFLALFQALVGERIGWW